MVGEGAVELEVHRDEVDGQAVEDGGDGVAAHAVAGVDDDLEVPDGAQVDQGAQVGGVVGEHVPLGDLAGGGVARREAGSGPLLDELADLGEAGVLADGGGAGAAHLDAVVLSRVVAGGEHGAGQAQLAAGEVQLVGGAEADLGDLRAARGRAAGEGPGQAGRGGPHVVARHDRVGTGHGDEGRAEEFGERLAPLVGDDSADVVRLHELGEVGHRMCSALETGCRWMDRGKSQPTGRIRTGR